jgi:hypothetical protein
MRYYRLYLRIVAIIRILNLYLIGTGVIPSLTITAIAPLSAHPLCRRFAVPTTTTLLFSN